MSSPNLVVLVSGGYDSALLLALAKQTGYNPIALLIDYGQKHKRELTAATRLCDRLEIPFQMMSVHLTGVNSGLTGDLQEGRYRGVHPMHVPGRNMIFVGMALSLAESMGIHKIWYGANMEDRINEFHDCTQEWVHAMNDAIFLGSSVRIILEAPLLGMRKGTIRRWGQHLGIKEEDVHSGYEV